MDLYICSMPERLILILFSLLLSTKVNHNKDLLIGKLFKGLVNEACKEMKDGGCMIYTYRLLEFKEDSVIISRQTMASCTPKERERNYNRLTDASPETFHWKIVNDEILIEGFDEYGQLKLEGTELKGVDKNTQRVIVFKPLLK
ncbi:MAG: hypothetical protein U0X76_08120 [Bacteroidia bacterium]